MSKISEQALQVATQAAAEIEKQRQAAARSEVLRQEKERKARIKENTHLLDTSVLKTEIAPDAEWVILDATYSKGEPTLHVQEKDDRKITYLITARGTFIEHREPATNWSNGYTKMWRIDSLLDIGNYLRRQDEIYADSMSRGWN